MPFPGTTKEKKLFSDQIRGLGKTKGLADDQAAITFFAIEQLRIPGAEVAREIGQSRSSICRSVLRGKKVISEYPALEAVVR